MACIIQKCATYATQLGRCLYLKRILLHYSKNCTISSFYKAWIKHAPTLRFISEKKSKLKVISVTALEKNKLSPLPFHSEDIQCGRSIIYQETASIDRPVCTSRCFCLFFMYILKKYTLFVFVVKTLCLKKNMIIKSCLVHKQKIKHCAFEGDLSLPSPVLTKRKVKKWWGQ